MTNKQFFVFLLLFVSVPAFADNQSAGFIDWVKNVFQEIHVFMTVSIPGVFTRLTAWAVEFYVYLKLKGLLYSIAFAYSVAEQISADLNLSGYLQSAVSSLPSGLQYILNSWQITNSINFILNCFVTRFVLNVLGW